MSYFRAASPYLASLFLAFSTGGCASSANQDGSGGSSSATGVGVGTEATGSSSTGGTPFVPAVAFAASPDAWSVPASGQADGYNQPDELAGDFYWTVMDMDGDKKPDLVHTAAQYKVLGGDAAGHWDVYTNTGNGFASTPLAWSVPTSGLADGYNQPSEFSGDFYWTTTDMDGDGKPDLVHTAAQYKVLGGDAAAHWDVYINTGSGFATTATAWAIPASGLADGYSQPSEFSGDFYWTTMDMDGDGKPDLVHTASQYKVLGGDAGGHWDVYTNTGSGFAAAPVAWPVPVSGLADGYSQPFEFAGDFYWTTMDMDGDKKPDLVHTASQYKVLGADAAGHWDVYTNTGNGFAATPVAWAVPVSGLADGYNQPSEFAGDYYWTTMDMDGDKKPDLVHTAAQYKVLGGDATAHWDVYINSGSGFAATAAEWAVPASGQADGYNQPAELAGDFYWVTMDMNGDEKPDLVHTAAQYKVLGGDPSAHWDVYRATP